ncbi:NACHT domain-containing protein [Morganella morganii]|uniref:NACHT domain-containing protein n=1 Tax=Morganella morganii TaxID=582 RepID=UPI003EBB290B
MATQGETAGLSEKTLEVAERVFHKIWDINDTPDLWHWVVLIVASIIILIFLFTMMLKAFGILIDKVVTFIEIYKKNGFPVWINKKNKIIVRRRKQFCSVLDADLSYLAKAENWNDQYFTDLEAEVETEGGYYASTIDKLRKKKSFGLRKERSLIRALKFSSERAMQLVGEPGSGKSVALRHLAKQFAEQGKKSSDKNAIVPLYINLREMEFGDISEISVDSVRQFILDNIRRGDADTSSFVKENWEDYCNRGIWLFLFDSFDEIPDVLHSATGSDVIRVYSRAIRQFLEGMGECKGILASREFKGPEALPWTKLRILPLSGEKQDELIRNSFLSEDNMSLVNQHLINPHSSIGTTPLFLTLLCRYVRDEGQTPRNDHDILLQHIERLAKREPEYLQRKYNLKPEDLLIGAERLAQLLAEEKSISLAPTLTQIKNKLVLEEIPGGSIENLISALVDSKIGRTDVPNAVQGDRRFAFAHRRYQEALFVRYLTKYPETISATELLMESRWREYAVTLLQTSSLEVVNSILTCAGEIIQRRAEQQCYNICGQEPLSTDLVYFDWEFEVTTQVISLLQDGLVYRLQDVPEYLSSAIFAFLKPRWENGDDWDRCEVLRLGGLLPHNVLVEYLVTTFSYGTKLERSNAFKQAAFTSELPKDVQAAVLDMLSNQVISAQNRAEQLTIEALAARLPENIGAGIVVTRGKRLRRNLKWIRRIISPFLVINRILNSMTIIKNLSPNGNKIIQRNSELPIGGFDLLMTFISLIMIFVFSLILFLNKKSDDVIYLLIATLILLLVFCIMLSPFIIRSKGWRFNLSEFFAMVIDFIKNREFYISCIAVVLAMLIFFLFSAVMGYAASWGISEFFPEIIVGTKVRIETITDKLFLGLLVVVVVFYPIILMVFLWRIRKIKIYKSVNMEAIKSLREEGYSDITILCSAESCKQLSLWVKYDRKLLQELYLVRTFSSFILSVVRMKELRGNKYVVPSFLSDKKEFTSVKYKSDYFIELRQLLEERFIRHSS